MEKNIAKKHEEILSLLLEKNKTEKDFFFVTRTRNNLNRLDKGYWFIGNDDYLHVSFWEGRDDNEKVNNIGFVVTANGDSFIEINAQRPKNRLEFLNMLVQKLGKFKKMGSKNKWKRKYIDNDYLKNLENFIQNEKPLIDNLIKKFNPPDITLLNEQIFKDYIQGINNYRNPDKIARISWNFEGWKFPTGPSGKSLNEDTFEAQHRYGHEEWLFDKSKIINGFHYAFLQPLMVESGKHIGKIYNISLYTINGEGTRLYVGTIKDVICISNKEALEAFNFYLKKGWLQEMANEIRNVEADYDFFSQQPAEYIFNIKFKFENVEQPDELQEIDQNDPNITTARFKLLPKRSNIMMITEEENLPKGNLKSTTVQKITRKSEYIRNPYHNKIQEGIRILLEESYKSEYLSVHLEHKKVDIKARTHEGKWHFFEIKTDTPKLCIRTALGQIMEYAYRFKIEGIEKLIIVGDSAPDNVTKTYLQLIRSKFKIPLYYKSFDFDKKSLSSDY